MLRKLDAITDSNGIWSRQLAEDKGFAPVSGGIADNQARMIDPLLAYYSATKDELAIELASDYAHVGLRDIFEPDGKFKPYGKSTGHIHSITSSLSGIIAYAGLVGDTAMLSFCTRIMDNGVPEY